MTKSQLMVKSTFEDYIVRGVILQYIAESTVSHIMIKATLIIYQLILLQSTCLRIDLLAILGIDKRAIEHIVNIAGLIVGLLYLGCQSTAFVAYRKIDQQSRSPLLIQVIVHLNPVIVYAVYPLQVWSLLTAVYLYPSDTLYVGVGVAGLVVTTAEVYLILTVLRNTVPSKAFLSCIDNNHEVPIFVMSMVAIILGQTELYHSSWTAAVVLQIIICLINILQAQYFTFNPKYWLPEANKWISSVYSSLLLCNVWNLVLIILKSQQMYFALLPLAFPGLLKLSGNILRFSTVSDFFDKKLSSNRRIQSIMEAQRTFHSRLVDNEVSNRDTLLYYEGIFSKHLKGLGHSEDEIRDILLDYEKVTSVILEAVSSEIENVAFWTLSSILWMILMAKDFLSVRTLVAKCKCQLKTNRLTLLTRLKQQHIITLIENKLDAIYFERINWVDMKRASIDNIYKSFSENNSDVSVKISAFNFSAPLKFKELFLALSNNIGKAIESSQEVYGYISERREKYAKLVVFELLNRNSTVEAYRSKIKVMIATEIPQSRHLPQYYFPLLYMYNVMLVHNSVKARSLLGQYKKKANAALMTKAREGSTVRRVGMNINSAYFRIGENIRGVNGYIKDATPNLKRLVDEPANGKLEGRHIHEFFLNALVASHEVLMNSSERVVGLLGRGVPFFVMRFDGFLKQVSITIKASSSLINNLEYYAEMTAVDTIDSSLVVLSESMELLGSELSFVEGIDRLVTEKQLSGVGLIMQEIPLMHKLLEMLNRMKIMFKEENIKSESHFLLADLMCFGKAVTYLNSEGRILYTMKDTLNTQKKKALKIACQLVSFTIGTSKVIKMYANFCSVSAYEDKAEEFDNFADSVKRLRTKKDSMSANVNEEPSSRRKRMSYLIDNQYTSQNIYQTDLSKKEDASSIFMELSCLLWDLSEDQLKMCSATVKRMIFDLQQIIKVTEEICNSTMPTPQLNTDHRHQNLGKVGTTPTLMINQMNLPAYKSRKTIPVNSGSEDELSHKSPNSACEAKQALQPTNRILANSVSKSANLHIPGWREEIEESRHSTLKPMSLMPSAQDNSGIPQEAKDIGNLRVTLDSKMTVAYEYSARESIKRATSSKNGSHGPRFQVLTPSGDLKAHFKTRKRAVIVHIVLSQIENIPLKVDFEIGIKTSQEKVMPLRNMGGLNSTLAATTVKSNTITERKVRSSLQNKKRQYLKYILLSVFAIYYFAYLSNWFYFEAMVNSHLSLSKDLFAFINRLCTIHFWVADYFNSFNTLMNFKFAVKAGLMTPEIKEMLNVRLRLTDAHTFYTQRIRRGHNLVQLELEQVQQTISDAGSEEALKYMSPIFKKMDLDFTDISFSNLLLDRPNIKTMSSIQAVLYMKNSIPLTLDSALLYFDSKPDLTDPIKTIEHHDLRNKFQNMTKAIQNLGLKYIMPNLLNQVKDLRESFAGVYIDNYNKRITALLLSNGAIMLTAFVLVVVVVVYIQRDLTDMVGAYSFLTADDLIRELQSLKNVESFLSRDIFDDAAMMREAHKMNHRLTETLSNVFVQKSDNLENKDPKLNRRDWILGFIESNRESVRSPGLRMASQFKNRIVRGTTGVSRATGAVMGRPSKTVIMAPVFSVLIKILIGVSVILMVLIDQSVKQSDQLKSVSLNTTELILRMHQQFSIMQSYSPYTLRLIENRDKFADPTTVVTEYKRNLDMFLHTAKAYKAQIASIDKNETSVATLLFGNMCTIINNRPSDIEDANFTCNKMAFEMATRGFVLYSISEHKSLTVLRDDLNQILPTLDFDKDPESVDKAMVECWFTREYAEMRISHHMIAENMLNVSRVKTDVFVVNNRDRIVGLMNALRGVGLTIVTLPFVAFFALIIVIVNRDYLTALYTFEIMSPDTVLNNQYVLAIFNKYFQTSRG